MAEVNLSFSQRQFRDQYGLCNCFFAITRLKNGTVYCPGIYNLKAPVLSPKQFAYSKR